MQRPYLFIPYLLTILLERLPFVQVRQLKFLLFNVFVFLLFASSTIGVYAEGSRDLITSAGGQGYRPFLQSLPAAAKTAGIARKTKVSVYVNAGEQVNFGSSVARRYSGTDCATEITNGLDIVYTSPYGTQNGSCDVIENGTGYIGTPVQEANGPQVANGYTPCKFTATETGIYEIEFFGACSTRTIPTSTLVTSSTFPTGKTQDQIAAWDVTVFTTPDVPGTEKKGRVFTSHLPLDVGGGSARLYSKAYFLTDGGYQYQISLNGIQPFEFIFFANNQGFRSAGEPLYKSVPLDSTTNVHNPANNDTADSVTHKLFFNLPASDLPDTTSPNPQIPRPGGTTWLVSTPPASPVVSNFKFEGKETFENNGNNCSASPSGQAGTAPLGGYFCFDANRKGGFILTITSSSGTTVYRKLAGRTEIGVNEVYWDGLDDNGNPVAAQEGGYTASVNFMVDDIHFPLLDVENATNGIVLARLNYLSASADPYTVYYDSSGLTGGTPPNPSSALDGVDSSSGAQKFSGNFGDNRGIDVWAALSTKLGLGGNISLRKADLSVTKTHSANPQPGSAITYTIKVTNGGPSNTIGIQVVDNFPTQITGTISWTCAVAGTGTCGSTSGTGNINTTVDLNSGAVAMFTVTGTVDASVPSGSTVTNSATITRPIDVTNPPLGSTSGDTKTETYTDTFSITPLENLPLPQAKDKEISTLQDTPVQLPALEGIDNASSTPAQLGIASYTITTLPPNGELRLGSATGTVITVGQVLTPAQVANIYYVPASGFIGTTMFNYIVADLENSASETALNNSGTERNGPAIVTITVAPNQPPVATSETVPPIPNNIASKLPSLKAADSDGTIASYTIQTIPDEDQGILYLGDPASGGIPVTPGQVLTPTEAANLYFKPATNFTGNIQFTFMAKDDKGLDSSTATLTIPVSAPTNPPPTNTVDLSITFSGNGVGNVKSENVGGIDCDSSNPTLSCNSSYSPNTVIKLVPKPAPGSQFTRWEGPEDCQDGQVTLVTATQCIAVFELIPVNLTVTIIGQGTVTSNPSGIDCNHNTDSCKQGFSRDSQVTLTAKPATGWRFEGWIGDCDNQGKVTMSFDRACQAMFVSSTTPTMTLTVEKKGGLGTVTSKPGMIRCGTNCQNDYSKNSLVELTATPEPGYKFTGWSGDCSGTGNPAQVTMDAARTCVAHFAPLSAPAKLEVTIVGQGRVESTPLGITCDHTTTPCYQTFDSGTPVNLAVIPDVGWHFEGWIGDCTQSGEVTVVSEQRCQALFVPADTPHVDLSIKIPSGNNSGTVTGQPGEINCGTLCNYGYARGVTVYLTAAPKPGYRFVGWGGNCSGTDNPTTVLMDVAKACTANFAPATSDDDDGDGTPSEVENKVPNKGDGNNDGIPDSKQPNVVSLPTPDGNYITVVVNENCKVNEIKVVTQSIPEDGSYQYPYVLDYDLGCTETEVTVYYHGVPSICEKTYRQYSPQVPGYPDTTQWQNLAITCGTVQIDHRAVGTANFRLKDGGSGDNSGTDGQIKHFSNWAVQSGRAKFSSPTYMVDEFGNVATITVQRVGGCEGKLTVDYQTQDMTATTPADYTTNTGSITWEDGDCSDKTFTVPVIDDLLKEGNETVRLLLFKGTENIDEAVLTIVDNETPQPPTDSNTGCYNLPACNICCSSCQPNGQASNLTIKSLIVTIKVGQTMNVLLAEGKGPLVIQEIPNSTFVSLDDWKPITNGVGEVVLTGVAVGNTKMIITDSTNTALQAILYINVVPDENAENFGIRSILTTIRVGQTLDMTAAGGKGTLSLTEIPSTSLVSLDSWTPLGDTGAAAFSVTGVKVGNTKLVMRDESTPPQWVTVHIKVVDGSKTGNNGSSEGTIPDNYLDNTCTLINAVAISASGQSLDTQDCFRGRINSLGVVQPNRQMLSRRQAKEVEVLGKIIVEPNHIGQIADILIVGIHKTFLDHHSFMRNGEEWVVWDEEINSLTPAQTQVQLPNILEVPIYHGPLDSMPGEYVVYLGYRLQNGTIVYNGIEPIHFYIGNGASIDMQLRQTRSAEVNDDYSASSYEVDTNSYFEPLIQNQDNKLGNYLTFPYTDLLRVSTFVRVDSEHVGRPADILMAAAHFRSLDQIGYKYDGEHWTVWDNLLESLRPVNHYHTLPATLEIPVYPRNLAGPGEFIFYVGYRLENGVTVFNGFSPIHFIVANGLSVDAQGRPITTTARFASWTYQNGYAGNPFQATVHRPVSLKATIVTDRNHIGKIADILMVAVRQPAQASYQRDVQQWGEWDEQLVTLKAAISNVTLESTISDIPIFEGSLHELEGSYVIYIGYRLAESGTIVYNGGETLQLNVR